MTKKRKGRLFIISAPSGCGKTTLCEKLLKKMPGVIRSVSFTTRLPRKGEKNGRDYFFVTKKEFEKKIKRNNLLEWARNFGYYYGTPKDKILRLLDRGVDVILAIDVKGAMKVKKLYPDEVFIFILPPSISGLRSRLKRRRTDNSLGISMRIKIARKEISYAHTLVNDDLKTAVNTLEAIIIAERCKIRGKNGQR